MSRRAAARGAPAVAAIVALAFIAAQAAWRRAPGPSGTGTGEWARRLPSHVTERASPNDPPSSLASALDAHLAAVAAQDAAADAALRGAADGADIIARHVAATSKRRLLRARLLAALRALDDGDRRLGGAGLTSYLELLSDVAPASLRLDAGVDGALPTGDAAATGGGGRAPPPAGGGLRPEPTQVQCFPAADSTELCVYEHAVCVDLAGPFTGGRGPGVVSDVPRLLLVASDAQRAAAAEVLGEEHGGQRTLPGTLAGPGYASAELGGDGEAAVGDASDGAAPGLSSGLAAAAPVDAVWEGLGRPLPASDTGDVLARARQVPYAYGSTFMDLGAPDAPWAARAAPLSTPLTPELIGPDDTVSAAHGGAFNGTVVWLPHMYIAANVLGEHVWGCAMSVILPALFSATANASLHLRLPPADTLVVLNHDGGSADVNAPPESERLHTQWEYLEQPSAASRGQPSAAGPWVNETAGRWCRSFLRHVLAYLQPDGAPPYHGKEALAAGDAGRWPLLEALAAAAKWRSGSTDDAAPAEKNVRAGAGGAASPAPPPPLPPLPYDVSLLLPQRAGTRVVWNAFDVPRPPPLATAGAPGVAGDRVRLCAKRGVALGGKPLMVGGGGEAAALRLFARRRLRTRDPRAGDDAALPPMRALVVDRGARPADEGGKLRPRAFANLPAMLRVLDKYGVPHTVMTDTDVRRLPFAAQARVWSSFGIIITSHGAQEVNLLWAPPRAALIEISPFQLWCPMYTRLAVALGLSAFPIWSRVRGRIPYNPGYSAEEQAAARANQTLMDAYAAECNALPWVAAANSASCVVDFRDGTVVTPLAQFEHALLDALEHVGVRAHPRASPLDLLDGAPDGGPGAPPGAWGDEDAARYAAAGREALCGPDGLLTPSVAGAATRAAAGASAPA